MVLMMQDVASQDAGKLLGLTNTCGTLVGMLGNLVTGRLASTHGYSCVFGITVLLYAASALTWALFAKGAPLSV